MKTLGLSLLNTSSLQNIFKKRMKSEGLRGNICKTCICPWTSIHPDAVGRILSWSPAFWSLCTQALYNLLPLTMS